MTQDFNYEVRNEISKQFKSIFKHIPSQDLIASKMIDRFVEVFNDDEEDV